MIKTGIVINIINKKAGIMTSSGEFLYIKINKTLPNIGEIYSGKLCIKNLLLYKYAIVAASIMFIFISSVSAYAYYSPVSTIILNINPSVSIKANKWNKIISSKPLNSDGALILNKIKLKNKSIDAGLGLLVKESETENFINRKYINDKKIISVEIKSTKNISIDISNFKNTIDDDNLNVKIDVSSANNKTIDITVNNKKINTLKLGNNDYKKETSDSKADIDITKNKPSKIKSVSQSTIKPTIKRNNEINKTVNLGNKNSINNSSIIKKYDNSNKIKNKIKNNIHDEENKNIKIPSNYYNLRKHSYKSQEKKSNYNNLTHN